MFPLLLLPAELRLIIYEHLFQPLDPSPASGTQLSLSTIPTSSSLSLLLTCRLIHAEAHRIAFQKHTFLLLRDLYLHPLQHEPRLEPMSLIRSLVIPAIPNGQHYYSFKRVCCLIRKFDFLERIFVVTDASETLRRALMSRKAHVNYRCRKARILNDDKFLPGYDLLWMDKAGGESPSLQPWRVRCKVVVHIREGMVRSAELVVVTVPKEEE